MGEAFFWGLVGASSLLIGAVVVAVVAGVSAALGYEVLGESSGHSGAFAQGFAAGALLAMVADTMLPEAYETEKGFTGSLVAVGFAISLILSSL